ncbi:MAG: DUF4956 domain-containing protein [Clostridia bacterium]|nr:DUF4956 domain-containing protein [Clostridia bacterium]MEE1024979.1 DUF4956 domain-containing protein [Acutalibacteraceae bacterium]
MSSFLQSIIGGTVTSQNFAVYLLISIALGIVVSLSYMFKSKYTSGFVITLALLPAIVQTVIMLVNGQIGTGIAVMGAFSLVRFRSVPGTAREIVSIFLAMAVGLAMGMGNVVVALIFTFIMIAANFVLTFFGFGQKRNMPKTLRIVIPENLDYTDIFDDIFAKYTKSFELESVKTTNMGSLYRLTYQITLKSDMSEKEMIDEIRCRNGNLEVFCGKTMQGSESL